VGVDRDRRFAGAASLNIASYMPDIAVNQPAAGVRASPEVDAKPEKPASISCARKIFFRNCAKHRLFSMLFFGAELN
jgi:hypothetical protein